MKSSKYNHFVNKQDAFYGYNFLYRTVVRLSADLGRQLCPSLSDGSEILPERYPQDAISSLSETGFIVPNDVCELDLIKFRYNRSLFQGDTLSLIILPTLWCNLSCPYCFENRTRSRMTAAVESALVNWARMNCRGKRAIEVDWFGGEPLLARGTLYRVSDALQALAAEMRIEYRASVTTNGTLIDRDFRDNINRCSIKKIQITLDGERTHHNRLRSSINGRATYDAIVGNATALCLAGSCHVVIRINCCDSNFATIPALLAALPDALRGRAEVFFNGCGRMKPQAIASSQASSRARNRSADSRTCFGLRKNLDGRSGILTLVRMLDTARWTTSITT